MDIPPYLVKVVATPFTTTCTDWRLVILGAFIVTIYLYELALLTSTNTCDPEAIKGKGE